MGRSAVEVGATTGIPGPVPWLPQPQPPPLQLLHHGARVQQGSIGPSQSHTPHTCRQPIASTVKQLADNKDKNNRRMASPSVG